MGFLRRYWAEIQHVFRSPKKSSARGRRSLPPLQPLEVRTLLAAEFTETGSFPFRGLMFSSLDWGDMDNDGDFDVVQTGQQSGNAITAIQRNNGNNTFTELSTPGITNVDRGTAKWGDGDNDGDLDLLIVGLDSTLEPVTNVYRNNGDNTFTDVLAGLTPVGGLQGSAAWGDSDNDGDLDILISGTDTFGDASTQLYINQGGLAFSSQPVNLPNLGSSSVAWGDYNGDSILDVLLTGVDDSNARVAAIYHNDGNYNFTNINAGLAGVTGGSAAWGDSDNDGDLDVLLTGSSDAGRTSTLYRNLGNNIFSIGSAGLPGVAESSAAWGDFDHDGDLDILLAGTTDTGEIAEVFRNNGDNTFTDHNAGLAGFNLGAVSWGDRDNDGDLDILTTGFVGTQQLAKFYRNDTLSVNTAPSAPTGLTTTTNQSAGTVTFSWNAPVDGQLDNQTPAKGLSYNLRIGSTPGGSDIFSSMANTATGKRRVVKSGPIQGTSYVAEGLDPTKQYYWSVQAIDTAFAGGAFAAERTAVFAFTDLGTIDTVIPTNDGGVSQSSSAWGDYDNDGDMDILLAGRDETGNFVSKVYRNNGNQTFTPLAAGLLGLVNGATAWGDYNNDTFLDILITGMDQTNTPRTRLYLNNGNQTFTAQTTSFADVRDSAAAWADMDNDGDLDLLLTGSDSSFSIVSKVYRNNGNGTSGAARFTDLNVPLTGVRNSAVAWGDTDNDGDQDLILTGSDNYSALVTKHYRNNGNSTFTDLNAGLIGVQHGSVALGDADNDGDLDLVLTGQSAGYSPNARVYRNSGNFFSQADTGNLAAVSFGSGAWGDVDNDGDLDLLVAGADASFERTTKVYRNNGNFNFTDTNASLVGTNGGTAAWGDVDTDGDLDVLLTGAKAGFSNYRVLKVYRNNAVAVNTSPGVPTGLTSTVPTSTSVTFSWTAPVDAQTAAAGLSYNLRVGTSPGASNVFSTMAHTTNGKRRLPSAGPIQGTSFTLKNLTPGTTYYWSVQSVDAAFVGGEFAAERTRLLPALNNAPVIGGLPGTQAVNDSATISPFAGITITDSDTQSMFSRVTILNGVVRGDFTTASATGWTRTVSGNNIVYTRSFSSQANIGAAVQAAIRLFVFDPRTNAIKPNTLDLTDITVFVNDGVANTTATTRLSALSVNDVPVIAGASNTVAVNDNATVAPLATLTITDADMQEMLISVTILNGVNRGDFTNATVGNGWVVRQVIGNNITYKRYFGPQANVGAAAQAAFRALVFQPRTNKIKPNTTELTDFQVTVSDGVAPAVLNTGTRVTTTSVNNNVIVGAGTANQTMNDNQTKAVLSAVTVTDPDTQDQFARVTITNGTTRGDFTAASTTGWTRKVVGANINYERFFTAAANNGAIVQAAIRALNYQPRTNIPIGTTELTNFEVFVNDGLSSTGISTAASVITTGVAPRPGFTTDAMAPFGVNYDVDTIVIPTAKKPAGNPLARLLKKVR